MPRQNRPLVRDGRLQAKKKRTDRSYLGGSSKPAAPETAPEPAESEEAVAAAVERDEDEILDELARQGALVGASHQLEVQRQRAEAEAEAGAVAATAAPVRLSGSARALQQQGRRRRELDVDALAERDTRYALHELRRILILTTLVIVTLIVLGFVLR